MQFDLQNPNPQDSQNQSGFRDIFASPVFTGAMEF
jgi:hypothetical protein